MNRDVTDSPRDEVTLTKSSVGVSGSASDEAREVYVLLRADESVYGAESVVGVFSTLEAAQAASGETGEWNTSSGSGTWSCGWHGVEAHPLVLPAAEGRFPDSDLEVRLVGLSADVSRLEGELKAANEWARVMEQERDFEQQVVTVDLNNRLEDSLARVAVLREALEFYADPKTWTGKFGSGGAVARDALASLRDAGKEKP